MAGDWAKLSDGSRVYVPDIQILEARSDFVLHPAHGHTTFIVEDAAGRIVGWMEPSSAGFDSVLGWMKQKKYIIRCTCDACSRLRESEGLL